MLQRVVRVARSAAPAVIRRWRTTAASKSSDFASMTDDQILTEIRAGNILQQKLEDTLGDKQRSVGIRRKLVQSMVANVLPDSASKSPLDALPFENFDYDQVHGVCCENVIGYVPIPVGVAGPLVVNETAFQVPMATTEGCLVASTNRGAKAITESGGASAFILGDGMTRAPVLRVSSARRAADLKEWVGQKSNFDLLAATFNSTSRFGRLQNIKIAIAGRLVYMRFQCTTGDAMGMNMITKGVTSVMNMLTKLFPDTQVLSVSGNFCTDKKPSAVNWIEGRGKSVVCEAVITENVLTKVLKTNAHAMADLNTAKNLIGSAMAGSIGGYNAHSSNIVTAIYLATGQDPAQNVESSTCMTLMEPVENSYGGFDLNISVTMPSIEVGTIGGGTHLPGQAACLDMLGLRGANADSPGANARRLAEVIAGTVMAGELSLMAALTSGDLAKAHMKYNRRTVPSEQHNVHRLAGGDEDSYA